MQIFSFTKFYFIAILVAFTLALGQSQALRIPNNTNIPCQVGQRIGVTDVVINWNAPGVKGRAGSIWGTDVAHFGTKVLGFGSEVNSPWRAGADECTRIRANTDVKINGYPLAAGDYALFMELYPDSVILIFNTYISSWGSYFYEKSGDVLRVPVKQEKDRKPLVEWLNYSIQRSGENTMEVFMDWEYWRISFKVEVDIKATVLQNIQNEMKGALGFDPPSLQAAANWCLVNKVNTVQALSWIESATNPFLGGVESFSALRIQSELLKDLGKTTEANEVFAKALQEATPQELHQYGRTLLSERRIQEAFDVFKQNFEKNQGKWPTHVGMMRGYSALGNFQKALEHAKLALEQAPDELNKNNLTKAIMTLEKNRPLE